MSGERDLIKWWGYIICAVLILAGIVTGMFAVDKLSRTSAVYGNGFGVNWDDYRSAGPEFSYATTAIKFAQDNTADGYVATRDLPAFADFDGLQHSYVVTVNDQAALAPDVKLGMLDCTYEYRFYSPEGDELSTASVEIRVVFLSNRTTLRLYVHGTANKDYVERLYCSDGFRLTVSEV